MPCTASQLTHNEDDWTLKGGFVTAWGQSGIEDAGSELHERHDVGVFSNGDYHQALRLLQNVEFTDLYYQLDMRSVILKCYYEMQDADALNYHLSAFRLFLSRNKVVSEYQRTIYRNLIKFAGKLMNAKGNPEKTKALKNEIENTKQIADLNWIKKKAEEQ